MSRANKGLWQAMPVGCEVIRGGVNIQNFGLPCTFFVMNFWSKNCHTASFFSKFSLASAWHAWSRLCYVTSGIHFVHSSLVCMHACVYTSVQPGNDTAIWHVNGLYLVSFIARPEDIIPKILPIILFPYSYTSHLLFSQDQQLFPSKYPLLS